MVLLAVGVNGINADIGVMSALPGEICGEYSHSFIMFSMPLFVAASKVG